MLVIVLLYAIEVYKLPPESKTIPTSNYLATMLAIEILMIRITIKAFLDSCPRLARVVRFFVRVIKYIIFRPPKHVGEFCTDLCNGIAESCLESLIAHGGYKHSVSGQYYFDYSTSSDYLKFSLSSIYSILKSLNISTMLASLLRALRSALPRITALNNLHKVYDPDANNIPTYGLIIRINRYAILDLLRLLFTITYRFVTPAVFLVIVTTIPILRAWFKKFVDICLLRALPEICRKAACYLSIYIIVHVQRDAWVPLGPWSEEVVWILFRSLSMVHRVVLFIGPDILTLAGLMCALYLRKGTKRQFRNFIIYKPHL